MLKLYEVRMADFRSIYTRWMENLLALLYGGLVTMYLLWAWFRGAFRQPRTRDIPPACLVDPHLGIHRFIKLQNLKLHFVEAGSPQGPLVLMIHGAPDFWFTWRKQIPTLANDFWVIAVDLRGCGDSDTPSLRTKYSPSIVAEDIVHLIRILGRKNAHLLCAGTGGQIGWHLAYHCPELVSKMVLIHSPHPYVIRQQVRSSWTNYLRIWYMFFLRLPVLPEIVAQANDSGLIDKMFQPLLKNKSVTEEEIEAYKFIFSRREDWIGPLHHLRQLNVNRVSNIEAQPGVITKPTLLVMGDSDPVLPLDTAYKSAEYVERISIKPLPGTGYSAHVSHAASLNQMIGEFLREMPWRPLSLLEPSQPSLVGRVMGASLAVMSNTYSRTTEALERTRALQGGLYGMAQDSLKAAGSSLGLGDMY
ncbi:epoxide hydrolase 4-like [Penaeus monodon]|uniref:epoxide hydrolase 4-like n=1 Tax=Penaeus monodon TaxID=6687 RepID=UPI0018A7C6B3|nr:epoxide hydrolase 4-like [Penaeus monodon]